MFNIKDNLLINQERCPICLGGSKLVDSVSMRNLGHGDTVSLRECYDCRHWWIKPLPRQELLSSWYENRSGFVIWPTSHSGSSPDHKGCEKLFLWLTGYLKKPIFNYLEIGCGTGNLVKYFSEKANLSYGVEPGNWIKESNLNIVDSIDLLPSDIKFDIIVLSDVLEHIQDPNLMMEKISHIANKKAIIYLTFPNKDCLKAQLMKGKWSMVVPFGHIHFFSSKSIYQICKKNGLKVLKKKATRAGDAGVLDLIKAYDVSAPRKLFRFIKSLILGQIILGKDQWEIILVK